MIDINLLPEDLSRGSERGWVLLGRLARIIGEPQLGVGLLTACLLLVVVGVSWFRQNQKLDQLRSRQAVALGDSTVLAARLARRDTLRDRLEEVRSRIALLEGLDRQRFAWAKVMESISRVIPQTVWLDRLDGSSHEKGIGFTLEGSAYSTESLLAFVEALEVSPFVEDVRVGQSEEESQDGLPLRRFTLTAQLEGRDVDPERRMVGSGQ